MSATLRSFLLAIGLCSVVAGCGQPDSATTQISEVPVLPGQAPSTPAWAGAFDGKAISSLRLTKDCVGYADKVVAKYAGTPPGFQIVGWGWNSSAKRPAERVLIADSKGIVVGAGVGGTDRPDVSDAIKTVTSSKTGWTAYGHSADTELTAWLLSANSAVCSVGKHSL